MQDPFQQQILVDISLSISWVWSFCSTCTQSKIQWFLTWIDPVVSWYSFLCVSLCFSGISTSQQTSLLILHQMMPNNSNVIMQLRSHFRCLYNFNGFANCPLQFSDLTSYCFLFPSFSQSYQLSLPCRILHWLVIGLALVSLSSETHFHSCTRN